MLPSKKGTPFTLILNSNWFSPRYKNRLHKWACTILPYFFKPNGGDVITGNLQILSKPKPSVYKKKNPWWEFWKPRYNEVIGWEYDVKIINNE